MTLERKNGEAGKTSLKNIIINDSGYFGDFGGSYVPEPLVPIMDEISKTFEKLKNDEEFLKQLKYLYKNYVGRPTPLIYAENLSNHLGGAQIYLKNEGLNHTGAHKINHVVGQALVAKFLGKERIIAETGAGQHGIATASVCAKLGMDCTIYMGKKDYDRQRPNVIFMEAAGAKVIPVNEGGKGLRDAVNSSIKDLLNNSQSTHYLLGTACGPHPYPSMNVFLQKVIGEEVEQQIEVTPDYLIACVGGGSNSLGLFYNFLDNPDVKMVGVEAGGVGNQPGEHAARFKNKLVGVVEGFKSYFLQDSDGQVQDTYSISAGLDYSGVSPQIAYLEDLGRINMTSATDRESLDALLLTMQKEGVLPALESSHALAEAIKLAPKLGKDKKIVVGVSGRGEKDLFITAPLLSKNFIPFLKNYIKNYEN